MTDPYAELTGPVPDADLDVLAVPGSWTPYEVAAAGIRLTGGVRPVLLTVDDRPIGVLSEEALYPVLLSRTGAVRGDGGGPTRTATALRPGWCHRCEARGWSAGPPPACPRGHGPMAPTGR